MESHVAEKLPELRSICARRKVVRLALFGSAASGGFDSSASDLDFLVRFQAMQPAALADAFFGLIADLERLFGKPVDLIEEDAIRNPYFKEAVEETRVVVYDAA